MNWYARPGPVGSDVTSQTFSKDGNGPNGSWNQIWIGKQVTSTQNHQNHRDARLKWLTREVDLHFFRSRIGPPL